MSRLVLDAEAFNALAGPPTDRGREVARAVTAAGRVGGDVVVPTVVLAELYRPGHMRRRLDQLIETNRRYGHPFGLAVFDTSGPDTKDGVDAEMAGDGSSERIVAAAGGGAEDDGDHLALVEIGDVVGKGGSAYGQACQESGDGCA